ncbi:MAG: DUF933 domain-containing protein [Candidatus Hatepunaea meridiana]|nr:DUF933 domain-containing protein [Candidatus Hatepunaea meridiana]
MKCGIVGLPLSGKSTLFNILTGLSSTNQFINPKREIRRGVARLEDYRLEALAEVSKSLKMTQAVMEFVDIPGISSDKQQRESYPPSYLAELHNESMLALVVREFVNENIPHPLGSIDPERDIQDSMLEFIISDLSIIERRLVKLSKSSEAAAKREVKILEICKDMLESGKSLREHNFTPEEEKILRGYSFLSLKPLLIILNIGEESALISEKLLSELKEKAGLIDDHISWVTAAIGIEAEINTLDEADRNAFYKDLGFTHSTLDRIVQSTFDLLGLITFLTTGDKETRAWPIPKGATALKAASEIHNDIARGFIRAEVCHWSELVEAGSFKKLKEIGKFRLEGKNYIVSDGEIVHIRFNI